MAEKSLKKEKTMTSKQHAGFIGGFCVFSLAIIGVAVYLLLLYQPGFAERCSQKSPCASGLRCVTVDADIALCAWAKHSRQAKQTCLFQNQEIVPYNECTKGLECGWAKQTTPHQYVGICGPPLP